MSSAKKIDSVPTTIVVVFAHGEFCDDRDDLPETAFHMEAIVPKTPNLRSGFASITCTSIQSHDGDKPLSWRQLNTEICTFF